MKLTEHERNAPHLLAGVCELSNRGRDTSANAVFPNSCLKLFRKHLENIGWRKHERVHVYVIVSIVAVTTICIMFLLLPSSLSTVNKTSPTYQLRQVNQRAADSYYITECVMIKTHRRAKATVNRYSTIHQPNQATEKIVDAKYL